MKEYETIKELFNDAIEGLFESDAQIVEIGGEAWGITCDTFSPREDYFSMDDPYLLGANLVAATLSDLTASGCEPSFFMHAMVLPQGADGTWVNQLVGGIKDRLRSAGCMLIGGDMGQAAEFSYTGIALGKQVRKISRIFPPQKQYLYITGKLGEANRSILHGLPTPAFPLHSIRPSMLACIDTSGGLADALWVLHSLNPNFRISVSNIPTEDIRFLFGGAGEYELLFTVADQIDDAILIGEVVPDDAGLFMDGVRLTQPPPDPRDATSLATYVTEVFAYVENLFGKQ